MTRIAFLSDTHNAHWDISVPKVDLLVHCGDLSFCGSKAELADFNDWIASLKKAGTIKKALLCYGNHERLAEKDRFKADTILGDVDIKLVHGCAELFGLKIWACSYVPECGGSFGKNESQLYFIYNQIPVNMDIVIAHTPPFGTLDKFLGFHKGSTALAEVLPGKAPRIFACGHIHSGRGVEKKGQTTFINCASVDKLYQPLSPIILEL